MSYGAEVNPIIVHQDDRYEVEYRKGKEVIIAKAPGLDDAKILFEWAGLEVGLLKATP